MFLMRRLLISLSYIACNSELFEFELSTIPPCVNVKGNLRRNVEFWTHIGTPSFILKVIERGFCYLSLVFRNQRFSLKNNRSPLSHAEFVDEAIQDLVESGPVVETNAQPRVVNPCPYLYKLMDRRGSFLI